MENAISDVKMTILLPLCGPFSRADCQIVS